MKVLKGGKKITDAEVGKVGIGDRGRCRGRIIKDLINNKEMKPLTETKGIGTDVAAAVKVKIGDGGGEDESRLESMERIILYFQGWSY